jgi:hypothetical protein
LEIFFFRCEVEAQYVNVRTLKCDRTLGASASNRQTRNGFYDARNAIHSVANQIANTWKIIGFYDCDDVERTSDGVDCFHHRHFFQSVRNRTGFSHCRLDENVCTCCQVISPLISGAILFAPEPKCQSRNRCDVLPAGIFGC